MAVRHRKLFPTNSTECEIYPCDPYPYPYPDFLIPLPPPPLPPPPPPLSAANTLSPYLIISLSLFAAISVLLTTYVALAKRCCFRRPRHQLDEQHDFMDHNHGPQIDHPIWYINTVGLQSSVINSIAIFKYKKSNIPIEGTTCSVCLSEFAEDETLRLLPNCNHAFHVACIDTWLRSHINCPLCRARILPNAPSNNTNDENTNVGNSSENARGVFGISGGTRVEIEDTSDSKEIIRDSSVVSLMREKGKRSVSMDSSSIGIVSSDFENDQLEGNLVNENFGSNSIQHKGDLRIGSSSSAESMNTSPVTMKRSFSCSGRLFSSSRYNIKSSILPL